MAEPKTKPTNQNPLDFLNTITPEEKRKDGLTLLKIFNEATGEKAVMWGASIVGFGKYQTNTGDWPLVGFSPRKQYLTLYVISDFKENDKLFEKLGKHSISKACLYINRLSDIDLDILSRIIKNTYDYEESARFT
jgi:hypothetical protein